MDSPGYKVITRKNPRARAGILSAFTFAWTFDLFRRGLQRDLKISDLCEPLTEHSSEHLGNQFEEYWSKELEAHRHNPQRKPSLIRIIAKLYCCKIALLFVSVFCSQCILKLCQPLLLARLLQYFTPNSRVSYDEAVGYASGVVLCVVLNVLILSPTFLAMSHLGMKIRVGLCSLIYRKSLTLSKEASSEISAGRLVNILSNDASRFDDVIVLLPEVIIAPLIGLAVSYLIWHEAGLPALVGMAILFLMIPLQSILAKRMATLRSRIAGKTDYRIRLMNEIVAGIQVIKMYAWEKSFAKLVALARRKEVAVIREKSFTLGLLHTACAFSTKLALYVSLLAYTKYGYSSNENEPVVIKACVVYSLMLCYTIVETNVIYYLPLAITNAAEAYVSIKRMEGFLMSEEATEAIQKESQSKGCGEIDLKDVYATWSKTNTDNTLENINIRIRSGSLVAVIGAVGSGKSSFLQLILRELPVKSGNIEVGGSVSYASQEPWLFGGTVCQNILFNLPMDKDRYRRVVRACALEADFKQLPYGDKTTVGDKGAGLSGGQRARINLARAVYRDADIYILDDPLSAVDSHVSRHLFDECICGYLAGKTVVLATHHVQRLTGVGHVIKLDNGKIIAQGSFQELSSIGVDMSTVEDESPEKEEQEVIKKRTSITHDLGTQEAVPITQDEVISTGSVAASVYFAYLKAVKSAFLVVVVALSFILFIVTSSGSDYWLKGWVNFEEYGYPEDVIIPPFAQCNRSFFLNFYGVTIGTLTFVAIVRTILYYIMCLRSSVNLHDTLFSSITMGTMKFFNQTLSGQILNRFSRDTGIIDETLPETLNDCIRTGVFVAGSLVIIFIVNWHLMVPFLAVMLVLYLLRKFYVATSRSIKRIESVTRSPIYTHVSASLQGLLTIRANSAEARLRHEFDEKMDAHSSAWYYILGTNRAFAYYVDLVSCIYISVVTFSFFVLEMTFLGGDVGLTITQSMRITFLFQWFIRQSANVENQMTSVERVCEYFNVDSESQNLETPSDRKLYGWPSRGAIEFHDVSLAYDSTAPPVLKKVNFSIKSGEKIGVVGRTGAGKSSLVSALFRLYKVEGSIYIDGVETSTIGLQDLRSKLSIIPQDPVIFSGTMRFNLDPFDEFSDCDLWNVLAEVELKSVIQDSPAGLLTNLAEGGVKLSVGQRQLMCLARAILRNSKVLILDEATANVDAETDDFIQAAIRKRFAHCTVLTIAHRLHTIMDSDRILVMDNGKVVEFGPPQILMLDPKGYFASMVGSVGDRQGSAPDF